MAATPRGGTSSASLDAAMRRSLDPEIGNLLRRTIATVEENTVKCDTVCAILVSSGLIKEETFESILHRQRFGKTLQRTRERMDATFFSALQQRYTPTFLASFLGKEMSYIKMLSYDTNNRFKVKVRPGIFVVGGWTGPCFTDSTEFLDLRTQKWEGDERALMPRPDMAEFSGCTCNGKLYVLGGHELSAKVDSALNNVQCYDPTSRKWSVITGMGRPRYGALAVASDEDEKVYLCGGVMTSQKGTKKTSSNFEVLDTRNGTWRELPTMISPRCFAAGAAISRRIYACGGFRDPMKGDALGGDGLDKSNTVPMTKVERFDQLNGQWKPLPELSEPRGNAMGVAVKNRLFVTGGYNMYKTLKLVEMFDPQQNAWSRCKPMLEARMSAAVAELAGTIYVLGGKSSPKGEPLRSVEWMSPAEGTMAMWDNLPNMKLPRYGCVAAGFGEVPRG